MSGMSPNELSRLRAVLPAYMKLLQDAHGEWQIYDESHDAIISLKNELYASDALQHMLSIYARFGRIAGVADVRKQLMAALGLDHELEHLRLQIEELRQQLLSRTSPPETNAKRHRWDDSGERCLDCGGKDWMGGPCTAEPSTEGLNDAVTSAN